jgi:hypothetical protein
MPVLATKLMIPHAMALGYTGYSKGRRERIVKHRAIE